MPTIYTTPPAAIAHAAARAPGDSFAVLSGVHDPSQVITVTPTVLRATSLSSLGDGSAQTVSGGGAPGGGGLCHVDAATMADLTDPLFGAIDHLVFRAIAFYTEPSAIPPDGISNVRMRWTVGATTATAAAANNSTDPLYATFPIRRDDDMIDAGDPVDSTYFISTGAISTQPNGSPWDQASINGLINVGVIADCDPGSTFDLQVAEIWVEVFGAIGTPGQIIAPRLKLGGDIVRPLKLTRDPH